MEFYKEEPTTTAEQQINTLNLNFSNEQFGQLPVMVELKPVAMTTDNSVQLFNISPVQLQGPIHYVATDTKFSTQTQEMLQQPQLQLQQQQQQKPCLCKVCGKRYANPKALLKHQVIHPEVVFDWACRICNKTFPYKITMSRHLKLHAGEKLFTCENCSKRFETRYALVQHVKLHKSNVPFRCEICDKPFLKSAEFARHVRTHTGEKPFQCTICDKSFTTRSSFVKHSEKKHFVPMRQNDDNI